MQAIDPQPCGELQASSLSVVVIAASAETGDRIVSALAKRGLRPSARIEALGDASRLGIGGSTMVVFACDIDAPREIAGLRRLCRLTAPAATVVVSPSVTGAGVRRALDAGAAALVFDSELELTLASAIEAVASGQSVVPRRLRAGVERPALSHRELEVLSLVRQGLTNAEIANRLFLAESTVKSHLASVFTKFGVHSRAEAATAFAELERGVT